MPRDMSDRAPPFVDGRITAGTMAGWVVRVEDDDANTGGYLILFWDERSDDGGDYWVEHYDDLEPFFKESGWEVVWEAPLDTLLRARGDDRGRQ